MRIEIPSPRAALLAAGALLALATAPLTAAVVSRDLGQQLSLIQAHLNGRVVYATIQAAETTKLPTVPEIPFTRLTLEVKRDLVSGSTQPETLRVFVPGAGEQRLSISPPESEMRVGESIVFFLRKDAGVSEVDAAALKVDSFAESFRTQLNRKGEVVVLGEGPGSAIAENTKLDDLARKTAKAVEVLKAEQGNKK